VAYPPKIRCKGPPKKRRKNSRPWGPPSKKFPVGPKKVHNPLGAQNISQREPLGDKNSPKPGNDTPDGLKKRGKKLRRPLGKR